MTEQLITSMATPFAYASYKSGYKKVLDKLVKAKLEHKESPAAPPERKVIDLQEALRRSLENVRPRAARRTRPRRLEAAG